MAVTVEMERGYKVRKISEATLTGHDDGLSTELRGRELLRMAPGLSDRYEHISQR